MRWLLPCVALSVGAGCYITERGQVQSAFEVASGTGGGSSSSGCGPATCAGCCTALGVCASGNLNTQCGAQGATCSDCTAQAGTCGAGRCSVATSASVTVRGNTTFISNGALNPLSLDRVALFVAQPDGGFASVPKTQQQGAVIFQSIPAGERLLFTGDSWVAGVGAEVDLSQTRLERSTVTFADAGLSWTMTTADVSAFPQGTNLQAYSPSLGLWVERYQRGAQAPLGSSTMTVFDHVAAVGGSLAPVPMGDTVFLSAMTPLDAGPGTTAQLATAMGSTALQLTPGLSASASVNFSAGRDVPLQTRWQVRGLMNSVGALIDRALPQRHSFAVSALPYAGDAGSTGSSGDLLIIDGDGANVPDEVPVNVTARSVFPTDWPLVTTASFCGAIATQRPDAGALTVTPQLCVLEQSLSLDLQPSGLAVVDIALDGVSLMARAGQPLSGVRVGPNGRLAWNPSAPAGSWELRSFTFDGAGWRQVSTVFVPGSSSSVVLPPGFLTPGQPAYVRVIGRRQTGVEAAPYRATFPWGTADVPSGVFDVR